MISKIRSTLGPYRGLNSHPFAFVHFFANSEFHQLLFGSQFFILLDLVFSVIPHSHQSLRLFILKAPIINLPFAVFFFLFLIFHHLSLL